MRQKSYIMETNKSNWVAGHKVTFCDTAGNYDLTIIETPAKTQGPPPHIHKMYNETFIVIEGEMVFFLDGKIKTLKAGEAIDIPQNTLHTFDNKSDATCKLVNIHSPKGFKAFFEAVGFPSEKS